MKINSKNLLEIFSFLFILFIFISCGSTKDESSCNNVNCSNHGECALDHGKPYCMCEKGYKKSEDNKGCIFKCNNDSHVNENNNGCILNPTCETISCDTQENSHCEIVENTPKCICNGNSTLTNGICVLNPTCEKTTCDSFSECKIIDNTPQCVCGSDYIKKDDKCILDCSNKPFSEPNNLNKECVCIDDYVINDGNCIPNPCKDNPCKNNSKNKTMCIKVGTEHSCICEDGFSTNNDDICIKTTTTHIRVMAGNITSGSRQAYDPGHGIRIANALKPDIMMLQEFKYNSDGRDCKRFPCDTQEDYKVLVELMFNDPGCLTSEPKRCYFYNTPHNNTTNSLPNGILSRYPIIEGGFWEDTRMPNRNLDYARVDIPGEKDLWVISVHLSTKRAQRLSGARDLIDGINSKIPENSYIILGGDFNTDTRALENDGTFAEDTLDKLGEVFYMDGPYPVDSDAHNNDDGNSEGTNASRKKPYDWVLATPNFDQYQVTTNYCDSNEPTDIENITVCNYPDGLVFDTRTFSGSDLSRYFNATRVNDSDASSMQHMAIVKDYDIILE